MTTLLLVRHGETFDNAAHLMQGQVQGQLNETGIAQAEGVRDQMAGEHIDAFVSSDLHRSVQTCEIIAEPHHKPVVQTPLLRERDWGSFTGKYIPDLQAVKEWPDDIEPLPDLQARAKKFLDWIRAQYPDQTVLAVPYDTPVIGYHTDNVATLRLWQCEAEEELNFDAFNAQDYVKALEKKNKAEDITRVLYPNDSTWEGKRLRVKQQYVLSSASLQDILRDYRAQHGADYYRLPEFVAVQLNDTHPAISIPELIRLLMNEGLDFDAAFELTRRVFAYTNHTVMGEALEKWDLELLRSVVPEVCEIIERIDARLKQEHPHSKLFIVKDGQAHMANLSVYMSTAVNGVAEIHSQILKDDLFKDWYAVYPERFQNKTNGITPRRWLGLSNPELCGLIDSRIGTGYLKDLDKLAGLKNSIDEMTVKQFNAIKLEKKRQLCRVIEEHEGVALDPSFIFDVQVKRFHAYKRQLLNIFKVMSIYNHMLDDPSYKPHKTTFIISGKAASAYTFAKEVIRLINSVADVINNDDRVNEYIKVAFIPNFAVSNAQLIYPAAEISEQISTAGKEASGTSNMKLMMNGAITLGTLDGANVEIAELAGMENEKIFGMKVEEVEALRASGSYFAQDVLNADPNGIGRCVRQLTDGTFARLSGNFEQISSELMGNNDYDFVIADFASYVQAWEELTATYDDQRSWQRRALHNIANSGQFSSDRTIREYASEIWGL